MPHRIEEIGDGFWNIRGQFKLLGVLDIGTQASLVRRASGRFLLLDSYTLSGEVLQEVLRITNGGRAIEAILNLHPFHTVHVPAAAAQFPSARLYGTARHHARFPTLDWALETTESEAMHALFADDLDFSVPPGVQFIPKNQNLHFASVLAFHARSSSLHVDDTLNYVPLPVGPRLSFHPTLGSVLERRPGAATEFRTWAEALVERCTTVKRVCTAHARLGPAAHAEGEIATQIEMALRRVDRVLTRHEARHG